MTERGPRYTSYPTAPAFAPMDEDTCCSLLAAAAAQEPYSVYVHLPFCRNICWFCGCNVVYTANTSRVAPYLSALEHELALVTAATGSGRTVNRIHLGGGTPTFLSPDELRRLFGMLRDAFNMASDATIGVELDPRTTTREHVLALAEAGCTRASIGVQDLDLDVQLAVNRVQPLALIETLAADLRSVGIRDLNVDLIYGLPLQVESGLRQTIRSVLAALAPERVSVFGYAHVPEMKAHQKRLRAEDLPDAEARSGLFRAVVDEFAQAGYGRIGLDHFVRPGSDLERAAERGVLQRNFQGYEEDISHLQLGLGVSAIGDLGSAYVQNARDLRSYENALRAGRLPVERGIVLSDDDRLRRTVIMSLMCSLEVSAAEVRHQHGVDFTDYFSDELDALRPMLDQGILVLDEDGLTLHEEERELVRRVCMAFDAYLPRMQSAGQRFSSLR